MAPCLQGQHRPSAQVRVPWRFDAPYSTAMLTPRPSSSLAASTQLGCLHNDFDAALRLPLSGASGPPGKSRLLNGRRHCSTDIKYPSVSERACRVWGHPGRLMAKGHGWANYSLYVDKRAVGVIKAKPEGTTLSGVEWQHRAITG